MRAAKWSRVLRASAAVLLFGSAVAAAKAVPDRPPADRQPRGLSTPRVAPLPEAQWTPAQKELVARFARGRAADNQLKTLLNVPAIVEGAMPFTLYLSTDSSIMPRHRELLVLRTAWLSGSQPLWATHAARAREVGLTSDDMTRVAQGPEAAGWTPFEKTLLQTADQLYRNSAVSNATWKALSAQYSLENLMDAVETVNHFTFLALLYNSLGVQPDAELKDRLPAHIPYRIDVPAPEPPLTAARVDPLPGTGIAVGRTFARHATLNQSRPHRANYINRVSPLSPRHREMLILRIGWDCQSEYEWAQHVGSVGRARDHGADPMMIARGPDAPGIDPFDAAILRAADELYRDAIVSDKTWSALAARFDTASLMSAVYTVGSYRATSMSLRTYGVQLEPNDERFPKVGTN